MTKGGNEDDLREILRDSLTAGEIAALQKKLVDLNMGTSTMNEDQNGEESEDFAFCNEKLRANILEKAQESGDKALIREAESLLDLGEKSNVTTFLMHLQQNFDEDFQRNNNGVVNALLIGNGDQSPLKGAEAELLKHQWGTGGDYNPVQGPHMSPWSKDCYTANLKQIKTHLEKDKKILDRRESVLRMNGLMHVIAGARSVDNNRVPYELRVQPSSASAHFEAFKYLISQGANIESKDVAGYTPLFHCLTALGNSKTYEMAEYLLKEKKADPNAVNRFGCTPLFEAVMCFNLKFVDLLLDNGADITVVDNDGVSLKSLIHPILMPEIAASFSRSIVSCAKKQRDDAKNAGTYRICVRCKSDEDCKRCTGCFLQWYCSSKCQKSHWKEHKELCRQTLAEYKSVKFSSETFLSDNWGVKSKESVRFSSNHKANDKDKPKKSHYLIKIQIPFAADRDNYKGLASLVEKPNGDFQLLVYNKDKTIHGLIDNKQTLFPELVKIIREKGVAGCKGYFYAITDDGDASGIKINLEIQPPETW